MKPKIEQPKTCRGCKQTKPRADYYGRKIGGYTSLCKECDKARTIERQYRKRFSTMTTEALQKELASTESKRALITQELNTRGNR